MIIDAVKRHSEVLRIVYALAFTSLLSIILILIGAYKSKSGYYYFLIYNLWLAYIPLLVALWLTYRLKKHPWLSAGNIALSLIWIGFLPNSFYMITDLIHVQSSIDYNLLYNIVILLFCIFNSLIVGYISVYLIHWELLKRFYYRYVHVFIGLVFLSCSFAMYLGRFLRWNSWDVFLNPAGLLFDVSDSISSPSTHPEFYSTITSFFLLLVSFYIVIWQIAIVLKKPLTRKQKKKAV